MIEGEREYRRAALRKEVADHEIFILDSSAYRDVAHRGSFHGRYANSVIIVLQIRGKLDVQFDNPRMLRQS